MVNFLFPDSKEDYYEKRWTQSNFNSQLDVLLNQKDNEFLCVKNHEFYLANLIQKIVQVIKGFFGFENRSDTYQLRSELLKFLYYGTTQGHITTQTIKRLEAIRVPPDSPLANHAVRGLIKEIIKIGYAHSSKESYESLARMRVILIDFHKTYQKKLIPNFWVRGKPTLPSENLKDFGDSYLELSNKAIEKGDKELGIDFLLKAHGVKNTSPQFQEKLWEQVKILVEDPIQAELVEVILSLGSISLLNGEVPEARERLDYLLSLKSDDITKRQIGIIYFENRQYEDAQPYLELLQEHFSDNATWQINLGNVYWERRQFPEAIQNYSNAIELHESRKDMFKNSLDLAILHGNIGYAYLKKLADGDIVKALFHLSEATKFNAEKNHMCWLFEAYKEHWTHSKFEFEKKYAAEFCQFLKRWDQRQIQNHAVDIKKMFLDSAEIAFSDGRSIDAKNSIYLGIDLFKNDREFIIEMIELSLKHKISNYLSPYLSTFSTYFENDSVMNERIGDIYFENNQKQWAVYSYQKAVDLYAIQGEKFEESANALKLKVGQLLLDRTLFSDLQSQLKAIKYLEEAAEKKTENKEELAKAYIKMGDLEKQKSYFTRDKSKIFEWYQKAFKAYPQNGSYLTELLENYLANSESNATELYKEIYKQPWEIELKLKSEQFYSLAQMYKKNKGNLIYTKACLKRAFELNKQNGKYKTEYFELILKLSKAKITKFTKENNMKGLEKLIVDLEDMEKIGYELINKKVIESYKKAFADTYYAMASIYTKECEYLKSEEMEAKNFHKENPGQIPKTIWDSRKNKVDLALQFYDKALIYQPENAAIHFDKGFLLDVTSNDNEALQEYLLACKHNANNPFYLRQVVHLYKYVKKYDEAAQIQKSIPENSNFEEAFMNYRNEHFCKDKTNLAVNPHKYRVAGLLLKRIVIDP